MARASYPGQPRCGVVTPTAGKTKHRECPRASPKGREDEEANLIVSMVSDRTVSRTTSAEVAACVCGRTFATERGMKIHRTKKGCLLDSAREGQRIVEASESPVLAGQDAIHSAPKRRAFSRASDADKPKRDKINFPPAVDKAVWAEFDAHLCCVIDCAMQGKGVEARMTALSEIVYEMCKEKFGTVTPRPAKAARLSRRARLIEEVRAEKKRARREWRRATEEERASRAGQWEELKARHAGLLKAERVAKKNREAARARREFKANPYRFAKSLLEEKRSGCLETDKETLEAHLEATWSDPHREEPLPEMKGIARPTQPGVSFDESPFGWGEIQEVVAKARTKSAPGPNGVPYVVYKRCPGVLKRLFRILRCAWAKKIVCKEWQTAEGIFIPKERESVRLDQFRPISLLNVEGKIFFAVIAKRLSNFLVGNGYVDTTVQKGAVAGVPGCLEHSAMTWDAIQSAKANRKELHVLWLDLANAYGSVPHMLIAEACEFFHVPQPTAALLVDYFNGLSLRFSTKSFTTKPIKCEVGIAMGCSVSPVVFIMAMQMLLDGVRVSFPPVDLGEGLCAPAVKAFMDDVTVLATDWQAMAKGLRRFEELVRWARMKFKAKKSRSLSLIRGKVQPRPCFLIGGEEIPSLAVEPVRSLGRCFDASLADRSNVDRLERECQAWLGAVDNATCSGPQKAWCYHFVVMPKVLWPLTVYEVPMTKVQELERKVSTFVRKWLGLPKSLSDVALYARCAKLQLPLRSLVEEFQTAKVRLHLMLRDSLDHAVRIAQPSVRTGRKWSAAEAVESAESALRFRELLGATQHGRQGLGAAKRTRWASAGPKERRQCVLDEVHRSADHARFVKAVQQPVQGQWTRWEDVEARQIRWREITAARPLSLAFLVRSSYDVLPSGANLRRWGLSAEAACPLCSKLQTLDHVLSACKVALGQGRYTWRHNQVLRALKDEVSDAISRAKPGQVRRTAVAFVKEGEKGRRPPKPRARSGLDGADDWSLACDLKGEGRYPSAITDSGLRPDLVLTSQKARRMVIVELTVPFETRIAENHEYKVAKYEELCKEVRKAGFKVDFFAVEVGARGFLGKSMRSFIAWLGGPARARKSLSGKVCKAAESASRWIWLQRNNGESTCGRE